MGWRSARDEESSSSSFEGINSCPTPPRFVLQPCAASPPSPCMPTRLNKSDREQRRRRGLILLMENASIRTVALAVGCDERTVKRWKARPKPRPQGRRAGRPRTWCCADLTRLSHMIDQTPPDQRTSERLSALLSEATKYAHTPATAAKLLRLLGLRLGRATRAPDGSRLPGVWRRAYGVAPRKLEQMARLKPSARPRLPIGGL